MRWSAVLDPRLVPFEAWIELDWKSPGKAVLKTVNTYPHDTIVVYDSSIWRMRLCPKSTILACYSLANVAIGPEDSYDWVGYIKMNVSCKWALRWMYLPIFLTCLCQPEAMWKAICILSFWKDFEVVLYAFSLRRYTRVIKHCFGDLKIYSVKLNDDVH